MRHPYAFALIVDPTVNPPGDPPAELAALLEAHAALLRTGVEDASELSFVSSAQVGDLVEIGLDAYEFGRTSLTLRAQARNLVTGDPIVSIERIVMVGLDEHGRPLPHGYTEPIESYERIPERQILAEALFASRPAEGERSR